MNIFEYIEAYTKTHSNPTYGDLMMGNKAKIEHTLDNDERSVFESIKSADRNRLINESRIQTNQEKTQQQKPVYVSGVGQIMQVC